MSGRGLNWEFDRAKHSGGYPGSPLEKTLAGHPSRRTNQTRAGMVPPLANSSHPNPRSATFTAQVSKTGGETPRNRTGPAGQASANFSTHFCEGRPGFLPSTPPLRRHVAIQVKNRWQHAPRGQARESRTSSKLVFPPTKSLERGGTPPLWRNPFIRPIRVAASGPRMRSG